jgi:hypothetical protein
MDLSKDGESFLTSRDLNSSAVAEVGGGLDDDLLTLAEACADCDSAILASADGDALKAQRVALQDEDGGAARVRDDDVFWQDDLGLCWLGARRLVRAGSRSAGKDDSRAHLWRRRSSGWAKTMRTSTVALLAIGGGPDAIDRSEVGDAREGIQKNSHRRADDDPRDAGLGDLGLHLEGGEVDHGDDRAARAPAALNVRRNDLAKLGVLEDHDPP